MTAQPLTIAQRRILDAVVQADRRVNAREIRVNAGLPPTTAALDKVQAALADLLELGHVARYTSEDGRPSTYRAVEDGADDRAERHATGSY